MYVYRFLVASALLDSFASRLPGPPLGNHTALSTLLKSGVIVGIGSWDTSYTQGVRFDLGWVRRPSARLYCGSCMLTLDDRLSSSPAVR